MLHSSGGVSETLSKKQAEQIIREANSINRECKERIEQKVSEFLDKVSDLWADENAVDFAKTMKDKIDRIIEKLGLNNKNFAETVKGIGKVYLVAGGMGQQIAEAAVKLTGNTNISKIKKYFANGENDDDFGFRNVKTGKTEITAALNELKKELEKISAEATSRINKINAFGNHTVMNNIASAAGKVAEIVKESMAEVTTTAENKLEETARKYEKAGATSETSSAFQVK